MSEIEFHDQNNICFQIYQCYVGSYFFQTFVIRGRHADGIIFVAPHLGSGTTSFEARHAELAPVRCM